MRAQNVITKHHSHGLSAANGIDLEEQALAIFVQKHLQQTGGGWRVEGRGWRVGDLRSCVLMRACRGTKGEKGERKARGGRRGGAGKEGVRPRDQEDVFSWRHLSPVSLPGHMPVAHATSALRRV